MRINFEFLNLDGEWEKQDYDHPFAIYFLSGYSKHTSIRNLEVID